MNTLVVKEFTFEPYLLDFQSEFYAQKIGMVWRHFIKYKKLKIKSKFQKKIFEYKLLCLLFSAQ